MLSIVLGRVDAALDWRPVTAGIVLAVLASAAAGWLPTYGLLARKPMDILRSE